VVEQVTARQRGEAVDVRPIAGDDAERGLEILIGQRETTTAILVRDAQDDERVGTGPLHQLAVRPGVDRAAALEVDVRTQDAAEPRGGRYAVNRRGTRSVVADEELLELGAQRPERRGVGTTRQRSGPPSRVAVLLVEHLEG